MVLKLNYSFYSSLGLFRCLWHFQIFYSDDSLEQLIARASCARTSNSLKAVNGELSGKEHIFN